jgi:Tfp pilus assembly protein PilO
MDGEEKKSDLLKRLHDPIQLRLFITLVMLAVGYAGIYMPLAGRIEQSNRELGKARKRQALARDIEHLRAQVEKFESRLPEKSDTNEWIQYVFEGTRQFPVKLTKLDSAASRPLGSYEAVVLNLELEGQFHELDAFLRWVEANQRLFRVESSKLAPLRTATDYRLLMNLTLLGANG